MQSNSTEEPPVEEPFDTTQAEGADEGSKDSVELDITAPLITLLGEMAVELALGDTYANEGATASDDIDGDITLNIVTNNPVDTNIVGEYTVTYNVTDRAGNPASEVIRLVTVIALPEPPVVSEVESEPTGPEPALEKEPQPEE
ncbi:MAG: DUF5011 domain-containing protein [Proteobacteria bacterium]|nr:DUF5011 domain-containing protein [Pseudomonadota bacterium]